LKGNFLNEDTEKNAFFWKGNAFQVPLGTAFGFLGTSISSSGTAKSQKVFY